jgi:hypothetical protein
MPKTIEISPTIHRLAHQAWAQGTITERIAGESVTVRAKHWLSPGRPLHDLAAKEGVTVEELLHPPKYIPPSAPSTPTPPPPPPLPETLDFQTGSIGFSNAPVGGWGNITMYKNGNYEFWGHFHDSGAPSYDAAVAWVVVDSKGTAFTFAHKVHLNGTFEAGSRDGDWDDTGTNSAIAAHWADLCAGYTWRWTANVNWDWGIIVKQVEDSLKAAGTIIGAVVAVVALL